MAEATGRAGPYAAWSRAALFAPSPVRAVATIAAEYALAGLGVAIGLHVGSVGGYLLAVLLIGTRQYALGECMAHEASHRNLGRTRWLNDALGILVCWPFFFTLAGYRRFHNRLHHRTSLSSSENSIYEDYDDWGLPGAADSLSRRAACWCLIVRPLVGLIAVRHLVKTIEDFYWDADLPENAAMLCAWGILIAGSVHFGFVSELILYWIVPGLTVVPTLNYWSEVGDHYRVTGAETRSNTNWFLNSLIAHNIGFHALHHRFPALPWFRLRRAYPVLRHELKEQVSGGYLMTFRQILAEERRLRAAVGRDMGHAPAGLA